MNVRHPLVHQRADEMVHVARNPGSDNEHRRCRTESPLRQKHDRGRRPGQPLASTGSTDANAVTVPQKSGLGRSTSQNPVPTNVPCAIATTAVPRGIRSYTTALENVGKRGQRPRAD